MEPNGSISTSPKAGGRIPVLETICSGDSLPLVVRRSYIKSLSAFNRIRLVAWMISGGLLDAHTGGHPLIERL